MTSPSPRTFWRIVLGFSLVLALFSLPDIFRLAETLNVNPFASKTILGMLAFFALMALLAGIGLIFSLEPLLQRIRPRLEQASRAPALPPLIALPLLGLTLVAYPFLLTQNALSALIGGSYSMRFFLFWALTLMALVLLQQVWRAGPAAALMLSLLAQTAVTLAASYLPALTDYPFALGWSETSRFYFPSLFLAPKIYGHALPGPILHPSLHLLLTPPYWFDAPLWVHRAWQVGLRFGLVGLIAPALLSRFNLPSRALRLALAAWIVIYLFSLPLYLHLALMIFPLLWLYRHQNDRRAWLLLILTSIWAGLSRLNWFPLPGLILSALYLLEDDNADNFRRLLKPAAWTISGTALAYAVSRGYILISGNPPQNFFTSLTSDLLWYRLWPNATYAPGVLAGILIFSAPLFGVLLLGKHPRRWNAAALLAILLTLFAGGLVVSVKIGGGADIHNMDAYAVLLLIVAAYAFLRAEKPLPWALIVLLALIPAAFAVPLTSGVMRYDQAASRATLQALQQRVDSTSGAILFITQRQLLSMHMLTGVTLLPEYEREDLMEMAMANNSAYLEQFARDVENQRFAVIVVDPLKFNLLGSSYAMGEENNAWARRVVKPILCWYRAEQVFAADKIALYVPREGGKACP